MVEEYVGYFEQQKRSLPLGMKVRVSGEPQYYGARIDLLTSLPPDPAAGRKYGLAIKVKNTGTLAWEKGGAYPVRLSYRWFDREGKIVPAEGLRTDLPKDILPGQAVTLKAVFERSSDVPEGSVSRWDMVKERLLWFSEENRTVSYYEKPAEPKKKLESRMNLGTITDRWGLWRAGLNMLKDRPVVGVGLGNFSFLYNRYKPPDAIYKAYMPVIHSVYLETLVETGILGFAVFLFFLFSALKVFIGGTRDAADRLLGTMLVGLAGCLVGMAFQFTLYGGKTLHYVWITLGLAVAAARLARPAEEDPGGKGAGRDAG
jgi:hypothetical protein